MEHYSWLYTIENDPNNEQGDGVHALTETVYALCNTYRDICSREVATWVAQQAGDADHWELDNLRAALEYYGTSQAWREDGKLVSAYNEYILHGQPWRTAHDALSGRRVTPLPEAVQQMVDRRARRNEAPPEFLGRRPAQV